MTLNVGQTSSAVGYFPLYVALQKQYFKAQGLTLNPTVPPVLGTGAKMAAAIESNSIELAGGGVITDAFTVSRIDSQIRLLGALTNGYFIDVTISKRFAQQAHLSAASSLEQKVKALVGKKIGITSPGSGTEALMIYLFRIYGYDVKRDAILVNLGGTETAALAALSTGRVDAISFFSPAGQEAEAAGIGDLFISPDRGDIPAMQGQLHGVFYTKQTVIDTKPKAVLAFIRAIAQAEDFIQKQPDQAMGLLEKYLHLRDMQVTRPVFDAIGPTFAQNPQISQKAYDEANEFHLKAGLIAIALPYKDMVATDTIKKALSQRLSS
ncbi:ABC transporter substrate-binding protein [Ktedonosporobacter rubrisoli]|nr:ABC transporter substrate-binding protein [Ktedonosporobacter rubrisoli]